MSFPDILYLADKDAEVVVSAVRLTKSTREPSTILLTELHHELSGTSRETHLILVVEDEPLIAMDIEATLNDAGFSVEICTTNKATLDWLAGHTPSLALLDIQLKDGPSNAVAALLTSHRVPFLIISGSDRRDADEAFVQGLWLNKPCPPELMVQSLRQLLTDRQRQAGLEAAV